MERFGKPALPASKPALGQCPSHLQFRRTYRCVCGITSDETRLDLDPVPLVKQPPLSHRSRMSDVSRARTGLQQVQACGVMHVADINLRLNILPIYHMIER